MTLNELVKLTTPWTTGPWFVACLGDARSAALLEVVIHILTGKATDLGMSVTSENIWHKDGEFSNIYAIYSLKGYRLWFVNWLPIFDKHVTNNFYSSFYIVFSSLLFKFFRLWGNVCMPLKLIFAVYLQNSIFIEQTWLFIYSYL